MAAQMLKCKKNKLYIRNGWTVWYVNYSFNKETGQLKNKENIDGWSKDLMGRPTIHINEWVHSFLLGGRVQIPLESYWKIKIFFFFFAEENIPVYVCSVELIAVVQRLGRFQND